jgi:hypothetical protein
MKKTISLIVIIIAAISVTNAQYKISGKVVDIDTGEPIQCADIYLWGDDIDVETMTAADGSYEFFDLEQGEYTIQVNSYSYRQEWDDISLENESVIKDFEMYSYGSPSFRIDDIASFDAFDMSTGISFYSPAIIEDDKSFASNITIDTYSYESKFKLANRTQMGFKLSPLKLQWTKYSDPADGLEKERYFAALASFGLYVRFIPTLTGTDKHRGMFIDIGGSYNIPYYFAHAAISSENEYQRTVTRHLHKLNEFEAMARIGFSWFALKATYRFTDVLKDNYIETPKLQLGVDFFVPFD